jgi:hypothetical protein
MPRYTFELHSDQSPVRDDAWFTNRERACAHAQHVARELMYGCELRTRSWRLDVYENGECVSQLPFASVDETLDHLQPGLRKTVERSNDSLLGLHETTSSARATLRESRASWHARAASRISPPRRANRRSEQARPIAANAGGEPARRGSNPESGHPRDEVPGGGHDARRRECADYCSSRAW